MKLPLLVPVALLLSLPLVSPDPALAQIASPGNAGGNSGNNSSTASSTPIGQTDFTSNTATSTESAATVNQDGGVTTTPAAQQAVTTAVLDAVGGATGDANDGDSTDTN